MVAVEALARLFRLLCNCNNFGHCIVSQWCRCRRRPPSHQLNQLDWLIVDLLLYHRYRPLLLLFLGFLLIAGTTTMHTTQTVVPFSTHFTISDY